MSNIFNVNWSIGGSRGLMVGTVLVAALFGFEIFNFDTTRYALLVLLGGQRFAGLEWAGILAFAFCSIDFAGLIRILTPEQGLDEPKEVWMLMGAWLLGATMNAMMTWYAVSILIAGRNIGTTLVPTADMLRYAPVFVAVLVWLTRILFIGSISMAADKMIHARGYQGSRRRGHLGRPTRMLPRGAPVRANGRYQHAGIESFEEDYVSSDV